MKSATNRSKKLSPKAKAFIARHEQLQAQLPRVKTTDGWVRGITAHEALCMKICNILRGQDMSRQDLIEFCGEDGFSPEEVRKAIDVLCERGLATHHEWELGIYVCGLEQLNGTPPLASRIKLPRKKVNKRQ